MAPENIIRIEGPLNFEQAGIIGPPKRLLPIGLVRIGLDMQATT